MIGVAILADLLLLTGSVLRTWAEALDETVAWIERELLT